MRTDKGEHLALGNHSLTMPTAPPIVPSQPMIGGGSGMASVVNSTIGFAAMIERFSLSDGDSPTTGGGDIECADIVESTAWDQANKVVAMHSRFILEKPGTTFSKCGIRWWVVLSM